MSIFFAILCFSAASNAEAQDMQKQYEIFKGEASKWQEYTLFKHHKLDEFWNVVSDTLSRNQRDLIEASQKIKMLSAELDSIGVALQDTKNELEASENVNSTIGFLGIQINKTLYNIVVWAIIAGLCVTVVFVYYMFKSSNKVTRATKSEYIQLAQEFSDFKEKSAKKQISLKRELQTAINTLEENRIKTNKLGYNKGSGTVS